MRFAPEGLPWMVAVVVSPLVTTTVSPLVTTTVSPLVTITESPLVAITESLLVVTESLVGTADDPVESAGAGSFLAHASPANNIRVMPQILYIVPSPVRGSWAMLFHSVRS
ncbi:MAG: hypothetical protein ACJ8AJ_13725 [Gemmatimonadaceae bacterium]